MVVDTLVNLSVGTTSTIGHQTALVIVRIDEPPRGREPALGATVHPLDEERAEITAELLASLDDRTVDDPAGLKRPSAVRVATNITCLGQRSGHRLHSRTGVCDEMFAPTIRPVSRSIPTEGSPGMTTNSIRGKCIKAGIGAVAAAGLVAVAVPGTSHADGMSYDNCQMFLRLVVHYVEAGDQATAIALFDNLDQQGCF
jgi:hypothetical protein